MESHSPIRLRNFFRIFVIGIILSATWATIHMWSPNTRIVFCDVGQGDGAYIRIHNTYDVLVDAGPDERIVDCLGTYMPFYDHTIELAILTHPQQDHMAGFLPVLDHYSVDTFIMNPLDNDSDTYRKLKKRIENMHIPVVNAYTGSLFTLGNDTLRFYWPSKQFLESTLIRVKSSRGYRIESARDYNDYSYIFTLTDGSVRALFTGDSSPAILDSLPAQFDMKTDILKIPHHGSINGLTPHFLQLADPTLSVISVGRHNAFNHPSPAILTLLQQTNKLFIRTDEHGTIVLNVPAELRQNEISSWLRNQIISRRFKQTFDH